MNIKESSHVDEDGRTKHTVIDNRISGDKSIHDPAWEKVNECKFALVVRIIISSKSDDVSENIRNFAAP